MRLRSERTITPSGTVAGEVSIDEGRISSIPRRDRALSGRP